MACLCRLRVYNFCSRASLHFYFTFTSTFTFTLLQFTYLPVVSLITLQPNQLVILIYVLISITVIFLSCQSGYFRLTFISALTLPLTLFPVTFDFLMSFALSILTAFFSFAFSHFTRIFFIVYSAFYIYFGSFAVAENATVTHLLCLRFPQLARSTSTINAMSYNAIFMPYNVYKWLRQS